MNAPTATYIGRTLPAVFGARGPLPTGSRVQVLRTDDGLCRVSHGDDRFTVRDEALSYDDAHDCNENAVPYVSDGALGHGWECGVCGAFLQAG